jgi:hypothetical protein
MPEPFLTPNSYASRHWAGDLSLAQAFWINVVAVSVALVVADTALTYLWAYRLIPGVVRSLFSYGRIAVYIWQMVGCWRSAAVYSEAHGASWGIVAQVFLILGLLQFVGFVMVR